MSNGSTALIAISLKMYFDPSRTMEWTRQVAQLATRHRAISSGEVGLVVLPSFPVLGAVVGALANTPVEVGAQDLFYEDRGAFTGAVSGADLRQLGCRYVEVGHVERRRIFGDDDEIVRLKVRAAWRNRLTPLLCVGESAPASAHDAAEETVRQLASALDGAVDPPSLVVAYEPAWAIGADEPADVDHIAEVVKAVRRHLDAFPTLAGTTVIYGGSAHAGMLQELDGSADGLFLGRFAHDASSIGSLLDETLQPR